MLAFLLGFGVLLILLAYFYFLPGTAALAEAAGDGSRKQKLQAYSALLLTVILLLILILMMGVFGFRRYFNHSASRSKTDYPDAWAESARRIQVDQDQDKID